MIFSGIVFSPVFAAQFTGADFRREQMKTKLEMSDEKNKNFFFFF